MKTKTTSTLCLVLATIFLGLTTLRIHALTPEAINFQGIARKADGAPVSNATVGLRLSIRRVTAAGQIVYQERHTPTTSTGGQFSIQIGRGTVLSTNTFREIAWDSTSHFLEIEIDPAGGTTYVNLGTQQFVSVPYALHSQRTDAVRGTSGYIPAFNGIDDLESSSIFMDDTNNIGIKKVSPTATLDINGNLKVGEGIASAATITATSGDVITSTGRLIADSRIAVVGTSNLENVVARAVATLAATIGANSDAISGTLSFPFTSATQLVVVVGGIHPNGANPLGDARKLVFTAEDMDINSCRIRIHNFTNSSVTFNCRVDVIAFGTK
jgi:hypothetical protein